VSKFFFVRHLPTEWNKSGLLQGSIDIPISKLSVKDKTKISSNLDTLKKHKFDNVLTSTLIRTQQTANVYGYRSFKIEPLLDELNFGKYEGKPKTDLIKESDSLWIENPSSLMLGESMQNFEKRLKSFLINYGGYKKILVFGHGAVIRGLVSIKNEKNINMMNKKEIKNNSITVI
jgi:broad specificity phosphatase PhoE